MAARKRRQTPAQRRASLRNIKKAQAARKKKRAPARRKAVKRRRRRTTARKNPARRKTSTRRKTVARRATRRRPVRRRASTRRTVARRRRRNPPRRVSVRGVFRDLQQGAFDAGAVVVGKAGTRFLANLIPIPQDTMLMNFAVQGVSAVVVGMVARMALSKRTADFMVAGGLAAPMETILVQLPVVGPLLGQYDPYLPMGEYDPTLPMGEYAMGEYPQPAVEVGEW